MTVLLHIIMNSYLSLIPGLLLPVQMRSTLFCKIGVKMTTGYVHVQELYLKLSDMFNIAQELSLCFTDHVVCFFLYFRRFQRFLNISYK